MRRLRQVLRFTNAEGREADMDYTDEELVLLAKSKKEYLEMLIIRYRVFVRRLTFGYDLSSYNSDDFMQEGLIALCNAVKSYDPEKHIKFSTYASACIKNRIKDIFKAASRDKRKASTISLDAQISAEETGDYYNLVSADNPSPEDKVLEEEDREEQEKKLRKHLSDMEFKVLMLRLEGLSYDEIVLDIQKNDNKIITAKMVDNALQRVRVKLTSWRDSIC
ncbi:MAG: sigma-70 family RNA polymerase sigma factor [Clostridia bacterium]|nr:sigma-70 family RNA polymerase sigma factor [Clostridia bacterium]